METPQADEYDDNGLPKVIWTERPKRKRGLTALMRTLELNQTIELGIYPQSGAHVAAQCIGIKVQTSKGTDGKIYVKRIA